VRGERVEGVKKGRSEGREIRAKGGERVGGRKKEKKRKETRGR